MTSPFQGFTSPSNQVTGGCFLYQPVKELFWTYLLKEYGVAKQRSGSVACPFLVHSRFLNHLPLVKDTVQLLFQLEAVFGEMAADSGPPGAL